MATTALTLELGERLEVVEQRMRVLLNELGRYASRFPERGWQDPEAGEFHETLGWDERAKTAHECWQAGLARWMHAGAMIAEPDEFVGDVSSQASALLADAEDQFYRGLWVLAGWEPAERSADDPLTVDEEIAHSRAARNQAFDYETRPIRRDELAPATHVAQTHRCQHRGRRGGGARRRLTLRRGPRRGPPRPADEPDLAARAAA